MFSGINNSPGLKAILGAAALVVFVLVFRYPDHVREYHLYLTETRPSLTLDFGEISQDWAEPELRQRFPDLTFRCSDVEPGEGVDQRACMADLQSHNGVPAMFITFYLAAGKVNHVGLSIPWWVHDRKMTQLKAAYGEPDASQALPVGGVRLAGWRLDNGSTIFFEREPSFNPLQWAYVFWSSERACRGGACIR
jgi:hypothetical protein